MWDTTAARPQACQASGQDECTLCLHGMWTLLCVTHGGSPTPGRDGERPGLPVPPVSVCTAHGAVRRWEAAGGIAVCVCTHCHGQSAAAACGGETCGTRPRNHCGGQCTDQSIGRGLASSIRRSAGVTGRGDRRIACGTDSESVQVHGVFVCRHTGCQPVAAWARIPFVAGILGRRPLGMGLVYRAPTSREHTTACVVGHEPYGTCSYAVPSGQRNVDGCWRQGSQIAARPCASLW